MTSDVRISAVIPTYNRGPLVARAVESVLAQSSPPDEIVVVDDGSTDDTEELLRPFLDRIRYVRQRNAGGSEARNAGVRRASHPWIAFLDSDDHWRPRHIELMREAIAATRGVAVFYFSDTLGSAGEGGRPFWEMAGLTIDGPWELREDATAWVMRDIQPMMLQSSVIRCHDFLAAGGLDATLALRHDTYVFFQLGLGRPACAVAGGGSIMTADDATGGRLSATHTDDTPRYWRETESLYRRVIAAGPLDASDRRVLMRRLAVARMRLARYAFADGDRVAGARLAARAAVDSPAIAVSRLRSRFA